MRTMVSTAASGLPAAAESPDVLIPGAKAGPWVVERELGRGGMGAVYAVVHEDIGKRAALKVVHKRLLGPGFNSDRMMLEAKVVNQVGHPNIVDIFETGNLTDGRPYIVMERLDGQSLSSRADNGKLLPDQVIAILLQICDALAAAHAAGVVHRDLKLDNVFLADNPEDPTNVKVKLLDWGIAKLIHHDVKHTIEGQLVGTPQYLSPEQARGLAVSPQSDVYSLGVMAYELFLEQLPFEAETAAEVMAMHLRVPPPPPSEPWPDIPPRLQDLLLAMLQKLPEQRPTIAEVTRRLETVRGDLDARRHGRTGPRHRTGTPIDASRPRVISSAGFAATEQADWRPTGTKRWQYTVGLSALVASAALFGFSRLNDHPAIAAPAEMSIPADIAHERTAASDSAALTTAQLDAPTPRVATVLDETRPSAASVRAPRLELAVTHNSSPAPLALRTTEPRAAAVPAPSRSNAARVVPARPSPAAPRRGAKVDPDGTIDPYL